MSNNCCGSPCCVTPTNTAACENLPSQIQNFTDAFFGDVIKTETNGIVSWSLPCHLDVGLPNNPRGVGEGLACYFLRLFEEGILGLTGPAGAQGAAGQNGNNAYTVTLQGFIQPSLGAPNTQIITQYNPAILEGSYIFVATSGWYLVNTADTSGVLFVTLVRPLEGAPAVITAGKLVIASGFPGASVQGPQGAQGPQGVAGSNASAFTQDSSFYFAPIGTDFNLQVTYENVNFVNSSPAILLPAVGLYKVVAIVDVKGLAGVLTTDEVFLKLFKSVSPQAVGGSEHIISGVTVGERRQVVLESHVNTTVANSTIILQGKCTTSDKVAVVATNCTLSMFRLS